MEINESDPIITIGKIQRVPLREVWKHEAHDFTTWLEENIEVLNDALGISLSSVKREQAAGDFSVDLLAEDEFGNPVVIENQLEKSNHDHLGKLLTYLVAFEAKRAIWLVSEPRPEHVSTITWLNESSSASFYLFKVEAVKIGDSLPAPLLTLVVGPSEEGRSIGKAKEEWVEREDIRYRFWEEFLERSRKRTKLHANISPTRGNWIGTGAGKSGLGFHYAALEHSARAEFVIDRGRDADKENETIFKKFLESRQEIEDKVDETLVWDNVEGRRFRKIFVPITQGGYRDEERWQDIQDTMIESMVRLEGVLRPYINKLVI